MKRCKGISAILLAMWLGCALTLTASANSSWHWISSTRPYDLLPIVITVTLFIETVALTRFTGVQPFGKVLCIVLLANSVSFAAPFVFPDYQPYGKLSEVLDRCPIYIVGTAYLLVTLLAELPVVYLALRKYTDHPRRLLWTSLGANVVTTALTALAERLFCYGSW